MTEIKDLPQALKTRSQELVNAGNAIQAAKEDEESKFEAYARAQDATKAAVEHLAATQANMNAVIDEVAAALSITKTVEAAVEKK